MPNAIAFNRWLTRLGFRRNDEPPVLHAVQPVQIAQDASELVSPALGPRAIVGGRRDAVAAEHATFEVHCKSAGGLFIEVQFAPTTTGDYTVSVSDTAIAGLGNFVAMVQQNLDPTNPVESFARLGTTVTPIDPQTHYVVRVPAQPSYIVGPLYVAPGQFFVVQRSTINQISRFAASWQEFPAGPKFAQRTTTT